MVTRPGEPLRYLREVVLPYDGDACLVWPYARDGKGYGTVQFNGRTHRVHCLACEDANGSPPSPKHETAHACGKGHLGCVAKRHLSWKTRKENLADMVGHGTAPRGEKCGTSKLTEPSVLEIRSLKGKMSRREIGGIFGVTASNVRAIHTGRSWSWLK